jgi:hypothetical protein
MVKELGKGAAAIFSEAESQTMKEESQHSEVESHTIEIQPSKDEPHLSEVETHKMKDEIDMDVLEKAIAEGMKYPKVTVYSPIIATVMRYREITTPRFKLSPEAEMRLEKVLRKEDPQLWKAVEEKIQWNKRKK